MGPQNPAAAFGTLVTDGSLREDPHLNLDISGPAINVLDVETSLFVEVFKIPPGLRHKVILM